jgi:hypothetical protein
MGPLDSPVTITPDDVNSDAGDASVVNADSAVYAKTHPATDTILRPTADGIESFLVLYDRTAPRVFSWTISLEANQRLVSIDAQTLRRRFRPTTWPRGPWSHPTSGTSLTSTSS